METKKIKLEKYKTNTSSLFTGRPQGKEARKDIKLDELDNTDMKVVFLIPEGTSSFNPSFYLGLLYDSLQKLGVEKFEEKYSFEILDQNEATKIALSDNLNDGKRNGINALLNKTGFKRFFDDK